MDVKVVCLVIFSLWALASIVLAIKGYHSTKKLKKESVELVAKGAVAVMMLQKKLKEKESEIEDLKTAIAQYEAEIVEMKGEK